MSDHLLTLVQDDGGVGAFVRVDADDRDGWGDDDVSSRCRGWTATADSPDVGEDPTLLLSQAAADPGRRHVVIRSTEDGDGLIWSHPTGILDATAAGPQYLPLQNHIRLLFLVRAVTVRGSKTGVKGAAAITAMSDDHPVRAPVAALQREVDDVLNIDHELDRQREVLVTQGWPSLIGLAEDTFYDAVEALRPLLWECASDVRSQAQAPFVLVASGGTARDMAAAEQQVPLLRLAGGSVPGVLDRNHGEEGLAPYRPIEGVGPAPAPVYALV